MIPSSWGGKMGCQLSGKMLAKCIFKMPNYSTSSPNRLSILQDPDPENKDESR